jgi:hypothetical protein
VPPLSLFRTQPYLTYPSGVFISLFLVDVWLGAVGSRHVFQRAGLREGVITFQDALAASKALALDDTGRSVFASLSVLI